MANRLVQAVYDLQDKISAKLIKIGEALKSHRSESDKTASAVERNNRRASDSYNRTAESVAGFRKALAAVAAFVGLSKVKDGIEAVIDTGERLDDLGKEFANVFGSVNKGADALDRVREIAKDAPQGFEDIAAAAIALRKAGFDPLDGSLQALIDHQNAVNLSQEQLIATIDTLGKANVKGELSIKNLVALTEQGVPVFELLGNAMGISADRARQLANDGKLGSDAIKLIVTELGKLRAGTAADELGDTDAQLQKLKDSATDFLNEIAHSGALDFFREGIKDLNDEVREAAKDGRLQALAKSISDGIVATASAVRGGIAFVVDYAGAIATLGKSYIIFRGLNIAGSLLTTASAMLKAGQAAAAASAEADGATGRFGKLAAGLKAIPRTLKLTVAAVGIEILLDSIVKITTALREESKIREEIRQRVESNINAQSKLAAGIAAVKQQYAQFADVAIAGGDELQKQGEDQLRIYREQLQGARQFFNAVAVEAERANDSVALGNANERLGQINATLDAVNQRLASMGQIGGKATSGLSDQAIKWAASLREVADDAKAAGDVVSKAFEGFDLNNGVREIGDFALGFDAVAGQGTKASKILDATLLESLRKLSGPELLQFQSAATAAIDSVGDAGAKNSATLRATLEVGLERLGVKAEDTGQRITKAGADTIATFTAIAENAQASAQTITAAFDAALAGVKTVDEAKALGDAMEAAAQRGVLGFKDLSAATRDLDERVRTITSNITPLRSQFELLGIKSQAQLNAIRDNAREAFDAIVAGAREGTAAQSDVVRAFKAYSDAARAAAEDSGADARKRVEEQLQLQAAVLGLTDALKAAGDSGKEAGDKTAKSFEDAQDAIDGTAAAARDAGDAARGAADGQDKFTEALQGTAAAAGGVIAITADMRPALQLLNEKLREDASLTNLSLQEAQSILSSLGPIAGGAAELLQRRISELEQVARQAEQTAARMRDEAASMQDEIDQLQGNDVDIEDRRHERRLADLKAEAEAEGQQNSAAYRQLVDLENKLHELKLKNLRDQGKGGSNAGGGIGGRPNRPGGDAGSGDTSTAPLPDGGGDQGGGAGGRGRNAAGATAITVNNRFEGVMLDDKGLDDIADKLARRVDKRLKTILTRSR